MKKIKVLHICEALGGGIYTYIKDICAHFEALPDFESTLIYSSNRDEIVTEKFDEDFGPNTTLLELPMTREISLAHDSKAVRQLAKAIREIRPDVIHLHSSKAGILGKIAAKFDSFDLFLHNICQSHTSMPKTNAQHVYAYFSM